MTREVTRRRVEPEKRSRRVGKVEGNPTVVRGAVVAVLTLLAGLGVTWAADVDSATVDAVVVLLGVLSPLVATLWARYAVTPNAKVVARVTTEGDVVAGDASTVVTGQVLKVRDTLVGPTVEPVNVDPERLNR